MLSKSRIIGIDYGTKRVGVAVSDESGVFALPFGILDNKGDLPLVVGYIVAIAKEKAADTVVMGESRDYSGKPNAVLAASLELKRALETKGLRVILEPEFMTSHQAERTRHELGGVLGKNDASAAAIILQSFLDKQAR